MARVVCDKNPLFSYTVAMTDYKEFAEDIARQAGKIIKDSFKLGIEKQIKEDTSFVTEADLAINALVLAEIAKRFPTHSVLSEEGSNLIHESEYVWVCDPLDGTKAFAHGLPFGCFSLALVKDGEVLLGVINDPLSDRLYSAQKGMGATLNGSLVSVSTMDTFGNALVNCDVTHRGKYDIVPLINEFFSMHSSVFRLSACIYASSLVAAGQFVASIYCMTSAHDAAAIKIIVEEAGGKVTDMHGREQRYDRAIDGLLVSNGVLHDELVALAEKFVIERK